MVDSYKILKSIINKLTTFLHFLQYTKNDIIGESDIRKQLLIIPNKKDLAPLGKISGDTFQKKMMKVVQEFQALS